MMERGQLSGFDEVEARKWLMALEASP